MARKKLTPEEILLRESRRLLKLSEEHRKLAEEHRKLVEEQSELIAKYRQEFSIIDDTKKQQPKIPRPFSSKVILEQGIVDLLLVKCLN